MLFTPPASPAPSTPAAAPSPVGSTGTLDKLVIAELPSGQRSQCFCRRSDDSPDDLDPSSLQLLLVKPTHPSADHGVDTLEGEELRQVARSQVSDVPDFLITHFPVFDRSHEELHTATEAGRDIFAKYGHGYFHGATSF